MVLAGSGVTKTHLRLMLILALAIGLRVLAAQLIGDARVPWNYEYEEIATNVATRGVYAYSFYNMTPPRPTSFIPPVYPFFLAFARQWTVAGDWMVKAAQIAFACLTILSLYALARELGASETEGAFAALVMAVYPPAIVYAIDVSTVTLETLFVIAGAWLVLRAAKNGSYRAPIGAGVMFSLATLTRSTWITLLPLAIVWVVWYRKSSLRIASQQIAAMLLAAAVFFAPWVGYNYATHGEWLLTSTNGGLNFWIGNNPRATGEYVFPTELDRQVVVGVADWPEPARDRFFYARGLEFIKTSPAQFLDLFARKLLYFLFFRPNIGSNYEQTRLPLQLARWLFVLSWIVLLPFATLGVLTRGERWREHTWPIVIFVSQAVVAALYFVGTRFRTPIDGFAMIWAAMGLAVLVTRWRHRQPSESPEKMPPPNGRQESPRHYGLQTDAKHRALWWLVLLTLVHGLWYVAIVHPWQAPDEYLHYEYLRLLDTHRTLALTARDRSSAMQWEIAESMWLFQHSRYRLMPTLPENDLRAIRLPLGSLNFTPQPPLYYLISLPLYWAVASLPVLDQLYVLRLYSVALQSLTVWLTYHLARLIFPQAARQSIPLTAAVVVALLPQFTFISASYNNDNLAHPLVTAALFALLRGIRQRGDFCWLAIALVCGGLSLAAKRTAFGIVPVLGIGLLVYGVLWLRSNSWLFKIAGLVTLTAIVAGLVGLVLVLVAPISLPPALAGMFRLSSETLIALTAYGRDFARLSEVDWNWAAHLTLESFWGQFGWLTIHLDPAMIAGAGWITGLLAVGCVVGMVRAAIMPRGQGDMFRAFALLLFSAGLLFTGLGMAAQYLLAPSWYPPQGRYLFPFIAAFAILGVWGWQAWLPRRWQAQGTLLGLGLLVIFDTVSWLTLVSVYYS